MSESNGNGDSRNGKAAATRRDLTIAMLGMGGTMIGCCIALGGYLNQLKTLIDAQKQTQAQVDQMSKDDARRDTSIAVMDANMSRLTDSVTRLWEKITTK